MNEFILAEVNFFLASFLWGVLLFLAYDQFVILRKIIHHAKPMIAIEDIGFWITAGILIFRMMYQMNDGVIRYYAVISLILGMKLYQILFSRMIVKAGSSVGLWIKKQIRRFLHFIASPLRLLIKQVKRFLHFIGRIIKKRLMIIWNFITNRLKLRMKKYKIERRKRLQEKLEGQLKEQVEPLVRRGVLELVSEPIGKGEINEKEKIQEKKKKRA
ncbi:MAG: spore cortex biosynthesis protein YabQ [Lachnospiraceae bacterium]|nr:spore cortex biosynthesis protein YabQ [Clostridiales bacterium]MDD6036075.1 spore cortex biosynthesis protein YabQ [Lachnospiraceae bacterium]